MYERAFKAMSKTVKYQAFDIALTNILFRSFL